MSARFRIRTSQGQELSFASHEMFAEFVRLGDLSPDDVVYDAETREWAPARTHPLVLQIEMETEEAEAESTTEAGSVESAADDDGSDLVFPEEEAQPAGASDIGLELAPAAKQPTPEEAAAAFVAKMEAERESDFGEQPAFEGLRTEQGSSGIVEEIVETALEPRPPPPPPRREAPTRKESRRPLKREKRKSGPTRSYAPFLILGGVVLAAGLYFGLLAPTTGEGNETGPNSDVLPRPLPPPLIPDTEEALRARAQELFLSSTQALLRDLEPIPEMWLHGSYVAVPSDHARVREVWGAYLTTIRAVRAGDDERYQAGYLRALDDARIQGSARTLRLASATTDFQADVEARAAHYDRVEALATAALQGHDALVEVEGTISYDPVIGLGASADPAVGAVGRGPDAQALLDQVLELVLGVLRGEGRPGEAASVQEWVWDGVLDAVTN